MKNYLQAKFLFISFFITAFALAQESPVLTLSIPYQNSLLYNRFLLNPTFSFVGENDRNISMFSRTQWIAFNDSPKVYQLNYSGRFSERTGFGISLYQQTLGVITSFGGIGNGAYYVPFGEEMGLTVGTNLVFYSSGVDMSRVDVENSDPLLLSLNNRSLLSLHPGVNFNYKRLDVGVYAENLVNYDFNTDSFVKDYAETTFSGHLMYTYFLENEGATLRAMARARNNKTFGFNSGLSFLANFPTWGWVQSGFDTYFGLGLGVGFHISKKLSVGYVYEKTSRLGMQNFGASHEFNLVFTLGAEESSTNSRSNNGKSNNSKSNSGRSNSNRSNKTAATQNSYDESETFKNTSDQRRLEYYQSLMKQDSIIKIKNQELEKKLQELSVQKNPKKVDEVVEVFVDVNKMEDKEIKEVFSKKTLYKRKEPQNIRKVDVVDNEIETGYYIVAGVFSNESNAEGVIEKLQKEGIKAYSFINPKNKYNYVYLRFCDTRKEALAAYYSNLDNTYFETIWLLEVDRK